MKSSLRLNLESFGPEQPGSGPGVGASDAALARQRRQQAVSRLQEEHAGALDIERLLARLPGGQSEPGLGLRRTLRQHGRYVRLSRPLGPAALTWATRTGRPGGWPSRPVTPWSPVTNWKVVGWLERLSGLRPPALHPGEPLTLEEGRAALLLPSSSGSLLLAERAGQVFQFLPSPAGPGEGRWHPLSAAGELQTGPAALVHEGALGLERQPLAWAQLSTARRRERARRVRWATLALGLVVSVLLGRLLLESGLWLLLGPALVALLLLCVSLERRCAAWVRQGTALRELPADPDLLGAALPVHERVFSAQHERLLSAQTRARLEALRAALTRARALGGQPLTAAVSADLDGLLEDRFSYLAPDPALDTLLEGQMEALQRRLDERLDLERQRARDLAAERLRRETIDPHF